MAIVVVGGGGRTVGKTALACGVIAALPDWQWVAVKIAKHEHAAEQPVWEETYAGEATDTARYLAAGARRAFLLTAADDVAMSGALDELRARVERDANLIFESNRVLSLVNPDVCLMIAEGEEPKTSFAAAIRRADAIVMRRESPDTSGKFEAETRPVFQLEHFDRLSPELVGWIRGRLIYC